MSCPDYIKPHYRILLIEDDEDVILRELGYILNTNQGLGFTVQSAFTLQLIKV